MREVVDKQQTTISLKAMKLTAFPNIANYARDLQCLTDLDLARNNLFNADELFKVDMLTLLVFDLSIVFSCQKLTLVFYYLNVVSRLCQIVSSFGPFGKFSERGIIAICRRFRTTRSPKFRCKQPHQLVSRNW
jgi:hypothetical protein